jgi:hypothetical protein
MFEARLLQGSILKKVVCGVSLSASVTSPFNTQITSTDTYTPAYGKYQGPGDGCQL